MDVVSEEHLSRYVYTRTFRENNMNTWVNSENFNHKDISMATLMGNV